MMICSTTGCCDSSVGRQERDYEVANLSRDEFSGESRAARGGEWMRELRVSRSSSDCMEGSCA